MALSCSPRLIIADEPTTALDVTIQAQILDLMQSLARETGTALIIITHNLGVVARYAQRVIVIVRWEDNRDRQLQGHLSQLKTSVYLEGCSTPSHGWTRSRALG